MTKNEVNKIIKANNRLNDFINGTQGYIELHVCNLPIWVFKEDEDVKMYYKLPYIPNFNYEDVVTFMKYAIPILTEMLKKERENKLMGPDCIKVP